MLEGKWIDFSGCEAPIARKGFQVKKSQSAVIQICGLGFFELYLNGKKVSDDLLTPVWSDYEPRRDRRMLYPIQDEFTHRVYYREYEVTDYITEGENHLAVLLGNGWYNQHERNVEGDFAYGKPKLCFSLTLKYQDGAMQKIQSDEEVVWSPSKIVYNNIYFGETQDFRVDESLQRRAGLCEAPNAKMERQNCPLTRLWSDFHQRYYLKMAKRKFTMQDEISRAGFAFYKREIRGSTHSFGMRRRFRRISVWISLPQGEKGKFKKMNISVMERCICAARILLGTAFVILR